MAPGMGSGGSGEGQQIEASDASHESHPSVPSTTALLTGDTEDGSARWQEGRSGRDEISASAGAAQSDVPWWPPFVLAVAVVMVSSAGAVMKSVTSAAPLALATWRLQATSIVLTPAFFFQLWQSSTETRSRILSCTTLPVLALSSVALAAHFGFWVFSLTATSLPHSLLFVSTPPLILGCYSMLQGTRLSRGELGGLLLGAAGVALVAASATSESEVTFAGDMAAFGAALAFAVYVTVAKELRGWMPLYLFALPVTAASALLLGIAAAIQWAHAELSRPFTIYWEASPGAPPRLEQQSLPPPPPPHSIYNPFAWPFPPLLLPTVYLALGPGLLGHTAINAVLRHISALTITMCITLEPPLGALIGWAMGETGVPSALTFLGGALLIAATVGVSYSESVRVRLEEAAAKEAASRRVEDSVEMAAGTPDRMLKLSGGRTAGGMGLEEERGLL